MEYTEEEYYQFLEDFDASGICQDIPEMEDYDVIEYMEKEIEF